MTETLRIGSKSVLVAAAVLVLAVTGAAGADFLLTGTSHLDVTTSYGMGELYNASTADVLTGGYIDSASVYDVAVLRVMCPSGLAIRTATAYGLARIALSSGAVSTLAAYSSGSVEISGGTVSNLDPCDTSTVHISGGNVTYPCAYDSSRVDISGGSAGSLRAYNTSSVNVSGGSVGIEAFGTNTVTVSDGIVSFLIAHGTSSVDISGGHISSYLDTYDTGRVNISGGIVSGHVYARGSTSVDISGGSVTYLDAYDTSGTTLHGYGFWAAGGLSLVGDKVIGTGVLAGKWLDGTAWAMTIASHDPGATILAKSPTPGDSNLDNSVDYLDLGNLAGRWNQSGPSINWFNGDFNCDGTVDYLDLGILAGRWNTTYAGGMLVPEPATLGLLALGALALIRRRRQGTL